VGDPGLGKSQMLSRCASLAPRGVFVTGNTTTSSGLTVTLTKEAGNDFALEAGALVLADQGESAIKLFFCI
jgi:DNA helicase MCM8